MHPMGTLLPWITMVRSRIPTKLTGFSPLSKMRRFRALASLNQERVVRSHLWAPVTEDLIRQRHHGIQLTGHRASRAFHPQLGSTHSTGDPDCTLRATQAHHMLQQSASSGHARLRLSTLGSSGSR